MTDILIVDDHALFRESLSRLLNSETQLVVKDQCSTVDEAIRLLEDRSYDLILLDFELGDRRGNEVVAFAQQRNLSARILIVTVGLTLAEVRQVLRNGADGIFRKNNSPELLLEAIQAVMRGERWVDPHYVELQTQRAPGEPARAVKFTERDRQVLRGVFQGMANKEIADQLGVSESAIKASLQQLFSKTGVRTRSQLVRVALEQYRRELL